MSMISQCLFLVVSRGRTHRTSLLVRASNNLPKLAAGEIMLELNLRLPVALFERPALRADVTVPADRVSAPVIDATVVNNIQAELERTLGVKIELSVVEPTRIVPEA